MNNILKKIRRVRNSTQQELADYIGVAYATINRWENEHFVPKEGAQKKLFEYCIADQIPVPRITHGRIEAAAKEISLPEGRILLYHGSKHGIEGEIMPVSHVHCDFGAGFYMGEQAGYPLSVACGFPESKFYLVSVNLSGIRMVEIPIGIDWAMLVAYHRGKLEKVKGSFFYGRYASLTKHCDMVLSSIVDGQVFQVLDDFFLGRITDMALVKCLSALKPEKQYVALTEKGCKAVKIEKEVPLFYLERLCLQAMGEEERAGSISMIEGIYEENHAKGNYFDEMIGKVRRG